MLHSRAAPSLKYSPETAIGRRDHEFVELLYANLPVIKDVARRSSMDMVTYDSSALFWLATNRLCALLTARNVEPLKLLTTKNKAMVKNQNSDAGAM